MLGGGSFDYGLGGFDFSYDEVKRAVVIGLIGFFLFIASAAKDLLYLKQITHNDKKKRKNQQPRDRPRFSQTSSTPLHFTNKSQLHPALRPDQTPLQLFPLLLAVMANPPNLPPGQAAFGRLSALNSPLPSRSGTPSTDHPIEFMIRQLAQARSALRLSNQDSRTSTPTRRQAPSPLNPSRSFYSPSSSRTW